MRKIGLVAKGMFVIVALMVVATLFSSSSSHAQSIAPVRESRAIDGYVLPVLPIREVLIPGEPSPSPVQPGFPLVDGF